MGEVRTVKIIVSLIFLILVFNVGKAQHIIRTGKIFSEADHTPLHGVVIRIKDTDTITETDATGDFVIDAPDQATLVFSLEGYGDEEIRVENHASINVTLKPSIRIGYCTVNKKYNTGAISSVTANDFNTGNITSPEELFQGRVAGVQMISSDGQRGAGMYTFIRGVTSMRNPNPLVVIDGMPLPDDDISPQSTDFGRGTLDAKNPFNFISPSDIERIDILKDGASTALYGERGSNGVVIITTRNGRNKTKQLRFDSQFSLSKIANKYTLLNREQFLLGFENLGGDRNFLDSGSDTDWQDVISRTAFSQRYDLSFSHHHNSGNYYSSFSYNNQPGVIKETGLKRITGRFNINQVFVEDRLSMNAHILFSDIDSREAPITNNAGAEGDLLGAAYFANPTWPASITLPSSQTNPLQFLNHTRDQTHTKRTLAMLSVKCKIIDQLNIILRGGLDHSTSTREGAYSSELRMNGISNQGRAYNNGLDNTNNLLEAFLQYEKKYTGSSLSAVAGYTVQYFDKVTSQIQGLGFSNPSPRDMNEDLNVAVSGLEREIPDAYQQFGYDETGLFINVLFPEPETKQIANVNKPALVKSVIKSIDGERTKIHSLVGRVNYTIHDKYSLLASFRVDASTIYSSKSPYGFFPGAAIAWRISEEDFVPHYFSDLKLRGGYGITGNPDMPYRSRLMYKFSDLIFGADGHVVSPAILKGGAEDPELKLEKTQQVYVGLDFGLFNTRITGSIDFYKRITSDVLFQMPARQPAPKPFEIFNLNAQVINKGVEVMLNCDVKRIGKTTVNLMLNAAYNKNEVRNFNETIDHSNIYGPGLTSAFVQQVAEGHSLYTYYLRGFSGFDDNGISKGTEKPRLLNKSALPKFNMGFGVDIKYGNWTAAILMAGQFGHYIYNNTANAFFNMGALASGRNVTHDVTQSNEAPINTNDPSERFLEKADYVRMQNLIVSYNINLKSKIITAVKLFVNTQNLFVITKYTGADPEVSTNYPLQSNSLGIDYTAYPKAKTFTFGFNSTF